MADCSGHHHVTAMHGRKKHSSTTKGVGQRSHGTRAIPRNLKEFFAKPERSQDAWVNVANVLKRMRSDKTSLQQASKDAGISPRTVTKLAGSALKKGKSGRYEATNSDRLLRVLKIPTADGQVDIGVRGSRQASTIGEYWAALHKYLATGDSSGLAKFKGKQIKDSTGTVITLLTDLKELNRLGSAGVLSFESLYAKSA